MEISNSKIIIAASFTAMMTVLLTLTVFVPLSSPTVHDHMAYACGMCWHVTVGQSYPAQFTDNDLGQPVQMTCTILSNDGKGKLTTSCLEK
jgi:hypothetical protein